MDLLGFLNWLFSHSLYQLWLPIIQNFGFQTPITLAIILAHNIFAISYLALLAALAYSLLGKKAWMLSFAVALTWILMGFVYLSSGKMCNIPSVLSAVLPHGWLEFTAIFYWVYSLRNICVHMNFESGSAAALSDYASSFGNPRLFVSLIGYDLKSLWCSAGFFFRELLHRENERKFLKVILLLLISALIEVYLTPMIVPI